MKKTKETYLSNSTILSELRILTKYGFIRDQENFIFRSPKIKIAVGIDKKIINVCMILVTDKKPQPTGDGFVTKPGWLIKNFKTTTKGLKDALKTIISLVQEKT